MSTSEDTTQAQAPFTQSQTSFGSGRDGDRDRTGRAPLRRARHGHMLGGVCAGLAGYLGIDVTLVRVAAITFLGGAGVPVYLACLLLVPEEGTDQSVLSSVFSSAERSS
jgi:phage shock protein C